MSKLVPSPLCKTARFSLGTALLCTATMLLSACGGEPGTQPPGAAASSSSRGSSSSSSSSSASSSSSGNPVGCVASPIMPFLQVIDGDWQQTGSASIGNGSTVLFGPQPHDGTGSWSWNG